MVIEKTEVRIALTIRQAQSIATILARVNAAKFKRVDISGLPIGMLEDSVIAEHELRNLLEFTADRT